MPMNKVYPVDAKRTPDGRYGGEINQAFAAQPLA